MVNSLIGSAFSGSPLSVPDEVPNVSPEGRSGCMANVHQVQFTDGV